MARQELYLSSLGLPHSFHNTAGDLRSHSAVPNRRSALAGAPAALARRSRRVLQQAVDHRHRAFPQFRFGGELAAAGAGDRIEARAAVVLAGTPLALDPAFLFQAE